uniref:RecQ-mediated genome instability protein 1 n=1 Tax=Ditylenchus dipsaci TaxID=166011 RepID=A0A915CSV3_9BILA
MQSSVPAPASSVDDLVVFFTQYHIRMKKEWLECAVKYVSLSNKSESCHGGLVFEQWLYSDIGESTLPCLKDAIKGNALNSVIVLQVVSVLDVGSPLLGQFNKLTYEANDNAEFRCEDEGQNTSLNVASRCLRLTLSDGATEVSALEYRPVPQLSLLICPGCKSMLQLRWGRHIVDDDK